MSECENSEIILSYFPPVSTKMVHFTVGLMLLVCAVQAVQAVPSDEPAPYGMYESTSNRIM